MALKALNNALKDTKLNSTQLETEVAVLNYSGVQSLKITDSANIISGAEVRKYFKYSRHPIVRSALDMNIAGVFWSNAKISACNDYNKYPYLKYLDDYWIKVIESQLESLRYESFLSILKSILTKSIIYGFAVAEIVWESKNGIWCIKSIKPKPSFDFDFYIDETDDLQSLYHRPTSNYLNPEKFVITTYPFLEDGNYYGKSDIDSIMTEIDLHDKLERDYAGGMDWCMTRTALHYQDIANKSKDEILIDRNNVKMALESGAAILHLTKEFNDEAKEYQKKNDIEIVDDRASAESFNSLDGRIIELEKRINRRFAIMDNLGQSTVPMGSYAKSKTEFDMFVARVEMLQVFLAMIVNRQIISKIIKYNSSQLPDEYKMPIWKYEEVEEEYFSKKAADYIALKREGIVTTNEAREALELKKIEEQDELLETQNNLEEVE